MKQHCVQTYCTVYPKFPIKVELGAYSTAACGLGAHLSHITP